MGLQDTPRGERMHIAFFGRRNVGKSSLVNAFTGQDVSVVSDVKGTTTDTVTKTMELLPIGPVVIIDTPGFDDEGALGQKRVARTRQVLDRADAAVLVTVAGRPFDAGEQAMLGLFREKDIPYLIAYNKCDLVDSDEPLRVSALTGEGIDALREAVSRLRPDAAPQRRLLGDLIAPGDTVLLITPIDSAAPKGRLILPQQQAVRDALDRGAMALVAQQDRIGEALASLSRKPALAVTDSQVFETADQAVPRDVPLTSFSILMARYKGFLTPAVAGVKALDRLRDGDRVLISEGCTHKRQCGDIGTVKLPAWIRAHTGKDILFEHTAGGDFPEDLTGIALVVHCGGCMLTPREVCLRAERAIGQGVPFTNYGVAIAYMKGILARSLSPLPEVREVLET